jgi:hypothetical protein
MPHGRVVVVAVGFFILPLEALGKRLKNKEKVRGTSPSRVMMVVVVVMMMISLGPTARGEKAADSLLIPPSPSLMPHASFLIPLSFILPHYSSSFLVCRQVDLNVLLRMRYNPIYLASASISIATTVVCISLMSWKINRGLNFKLQ